MSFSLAISQVLGGHASLGLMLRDLEGQTAKSCDTDKGIYLMISQQSAQAYNSMCKSSTYAYTLQLVQIYDLWLRELQVAATGQTVCSTSW